jgi:hypothetical protein
MFENRVLMKACEPNEKQMAGEWSRLHNEELHYLHASPNIIKVIKSKSMRGVGHEACMGEMRNVYRILVKKPGDKRPLERPRHRQEDNIRIYLREMECVDWIHLTQYRDLRQTLVNTVMNFRAPHKAESFLTS